MNKRELLKRKKLFEYFDSIKKKLFKNKKSNKENEVKKNIILFWKSYKIKKRKKTNNFSFLVKINWLLIIIKLIYLGIISRK